MLFCKLVIGFTWGYVILQSTVCMGFFGDGHFSKFTLDFQGMDMGGCYIVWVVVVFIWDLYGDCGI